MRIGNFVILCFIPGCGRLALLFLKYFSDSTILPFNLKNFAERITETLDKFNEDGTADKIKKIYDKYDAFTLEASLMLSVTARYTGRIADMEIYGDPYEIRRVNDQLIKFEQIFLLPAGLPGRPVIR